MDVTPDQLPAPERRWTLLDLIGVVTACAVGLGGWLYNTRHYAHLTGEKHAPPGSLHDWTNLGSDLALALAWMVVLRGLAAPRPRPLTYGSVACLAVLLATGFWFVTGFAQQYHERRIFDFNSGVQHALLTCVTVPWEPAVSCGAIVLGWLVLGRLGAHTRSSSGLDRLGLAVAAWFLLAFVARIGADLIRLSNELTSQTISSPF